MRFRVFALVCLFVSFAAAALGQTCTAPAAGYSEVCGSSLTDSSGNLISNATISFQPTDNYGNPISYKVSGHGQSISWPSTAQVTSGAFQIKVADTALTSPANVCYAVTVTDNTTGKVQLSSGYTCVQPAGSGIAVTGGSPWCTAASGGSGGTCNFDNYTPNFTAGVVVQTGPAGPAGPQCSIGSGVCTMTVPIVLPADPTTSLQAATKNYVDTHSSSATAVPAAGGSWTVPAALDATGATDNSTAINGYISTQLTSNLGSTNYLQLPPGTFYTPSLSNNYGLPIHGAGILLKSISQTNGTTATKAQINSYASQAPRLTFGGEYLSHWLAKAEANLPSYTAAIEVVFAGDSRISGNNLTFAYEYPQLFFQDATSRGILTTNGTTPVNHGNSGQGTAYWLSTALAADQALNPDLYIVNYGYNDPLLGLTPAQTCANIRSGLATIRGSKTVDQETIVLVTPIAGNDNPSGRAPIDLEQYRNCYAQAAHDYQAGFVDWYGLMPDNDFTVQTCMMDLIASGTPDIHIHPGICKSPGYAKLLNDFLLDPLTAVSGSGKPNISSAINSPNSTAAPSTYPYGVSLYRASVGSWPYNGQVITFSHIDATDIMQINCPYGASTTTCAMRTAASSSAWNAWVYLPEVPNTGTTWSSSTTPTTAAAGSGVNLQRSWAGPPLNGQVFSLCNLTNLCFQVNSAYNLGYTTFAVRSSSSSTAWNTWETVPVTADSSSTAGDIIVYNDAAASQVHDSGLKATAVPQSVSNCGSTTTCANTAQSSPRIVWGNVTLASGTATITGISPAFASTSSFDCVGTDQTSAAAVKIVPASTSSITVTGTGTDVITYQCIGN
ncbi:MAG: SGNH/GDSL hydrolase family protein [Patescibacteria group bacterium]|nr:SGNH/GDSL hydrolase family protein [Patescibacteria group bacterium]